MAAIIFFSVIGILFILISLSFLVKDNSTKPISMQNIKDNWEKSGHDYPKKFDEYLKESK
jgi:hypothetical protein